MDAGSELEHEILGVLRVYKSGRVKRLDGTDTVPPSPSGDPANGVASKDVVLDHNTAKRLRKEGIEGHGDKVSGVALLHSYFWGKEPVGAESTDGGYRGGLEQVWDVACGGKSDGECLAELGVSVDRGLSSEEAATRLVRYGPNELERHAPPSLWKLVLE